MFHLEDDQDDGDEDDKDHDHSDTNDHQHNLKQGKTMPISRTEKMVMEEDENDDDDNGSSSSPSASASASEDTPCRGEPGMVVKQREHHHHHHQQQQQKRKQPEGTDDDETATPVHTIVQKDLITGLPITPMGLPTMRLPVGDGSRFYIQKRVLVGNVSQFLPVDKRGSNSRATHKWMIYLRAPEDHTEMTSTTKTLTNTTTTTTTTTDEEMEMETGTGTEVTFRDTLSRNINGWLLSLSLLSCPLSFDIDRNARWVRIFAACASTCTRRTGQTM